MTKEQLIAFRYMARKTFTKALYVSNEALNEVGIKFHAHLQAQIPIETFIKIVPKDHIQIIMHSKNPLKIHGFHPAYVGHFQAWTKEMAENYQKEVKI